MDVIAAIGIIAMVLAFVYAFVRKAPLSLALTIASLAIYGLLAATSRTWGQPQTSPGYLELALWHKGGWRIEELPAFFTTMFVHADMLHLGFNAAAMILIGTTLEDRISTPAFAFVFIVGGLAGTLTYYLLHYSSWFVVLGMSGAISAELGAYARLYPRDRMMLFFPVAVPALPVIWVAVGFVLISSVMVYVVPGVAHEAHIGGLLTGLFLAPLAKRLPARRRPVYGELATEPLESLATTQELKDILETIRTEKIADVRSAWIDRFVHRARCPRCGGPLRRSRGRVVSDCGWRLRLR